MNQSFPSKHQYILQGKKIILHFSVFIALA